MTNPPRPPIGLLHFTLLGGKRCSADISLIRNLIEAEDRGTSVYYRDSGQHSAKESFDELTARYDAIVRGKPSVEIEGDPRGEK